MLRTLGMFKCQHTEPSTSITLPNLETIAKETKLIQRISAQFNAESFLLMLMQTTIEGKGSFSMMANKLGEKKNLLSMAKQSLWERFNKHAIAFLLRVNEDLVSQRLAPVRKALKNSPIQRIIIEDSTHLVLPKRNAEAFPAHGNRYGSTAGAKIDLAYDLLSGSVVSHSLELATRQDKVIGKEAVYDLQKGDLILRDMGYFILSEFQHIETLGAHWLSRLPATCNVNTSTGKSLEKLLKQAKGDLIDQPVFGRRKGKTPLSSRRHKSRPRNHQRTSKTTPRRSEKSREKALPRRPYSRRMASHTNLLKSRRSQCPRTSHLVRGTLDHRAPI